VENQLAYPLKTGYFLHSGLNLAGAPRVFTQVALFFD